MTRRRRSLLLVGLALLLGGLAATDVAQREAALEQRLGPALPVVVARADLPPGAELTRTRLAVRRVPARYAPVGAAAEPREVLGGRVAVPVPAGAYVGPEHLQRAEAPGGGAPVRRGERVAEVLARGSPELVEPGSRVDVVITRESDRGGSGGTVLALEDVEVLAAAPAEADAEADGPRVSASLRVDVRQAVYLAAAQAFAREIRLLPRAADDRRHGAAGTEVGPTLGR